MPPGNVASTLGTKRFFSADHFSNCQYGNTDGDPRRRLLTGCQNSFSDRGGVYFPHGHTKVATYGGGLSEPRSRKDAPCDGIRYDQMSRRVRLLQMIRKTRTINTLDSGVVLRKRA